jgi:Ca2+-binding RTX toxin-like protein
MVNESLPGPQAVSGKPGLARLFAADGPPPPQVDGTSGDDTLNGTVGNDLIDGLGGNDTLFMQQGGDDQANGGDGDDATYFGAAANGSDGADGGPGTDTLILQGNYPALVLGAGVINNEVLLVASGSDTRFGDTANNRYDYAITSNDANVAAGQTLIVIATGLLAGEDLVFNGSAETDGNLRIFAGQSTDILTGGAGSDGFFFGADGNWSTGDRVDGGPGIDSLAFRGQRGGSNPIIFAENAFTNIEVLVLLTGKANPFGGPIVSGGYDYNITLADGNIAAGQRLDIVGTSLSLFEIMAIDASAETDGSVRIFGGGEQDRLTGSSGNDLLYGGVGGDLLTGGPGADIYAYRDVAESTDQRTDGLLFDGSDKIDLSFIDAVSGTPANESFTFIGSTAFANVAGQLRAVQSSANQWLVEADVNGDGAADLVIDVFTTSAAVQIVSDRFVL